MYKIGICSDGIDVCTSIENMVLSWAKVKNTIVDIANNVTGSVSYYYGSTNKITHSENF